MVIYSRMDVDKFLKEFDF
ncbi:unnamed protein product [Leptidea sinapis]|uniref:Uncharacterized protein n=1 Tax=Leptidea sinapis TaxID=189913 RepID=A0A5E4QB52_9NEOP|nr:unnamed protein product [Leptidea sinapis]